MKSIAIVGFAPLTWKYATESKADEIWVMNQAHTLGDQLRISRLYEIHPLDYIFDPRAPRSDEHRAWLIGPKDYPVYMQDKYPDIPESVKYPLDELLTSIFINHRVGIPGNYETDYFFTSTAEMMIAHALYERVQSIEIYGIEAGSGTEYIYQRDGLAYIIGLAEGLGVPVYRHPLSRLLKAKIYGYEGFQMITRQTLERYLGEYRQEFSLWAARANSLRTAYNHVAMQEKPDPEELSTKFQQMNIAIKTLSGYDFATQVIEHLIKECDLQETDRQLDQRIQTVPVDFELEEVIAEGD